MRVLAFSSCAYKRDLTNLFHKSVTVYYTNTNDKEEYGRQLEMCFYKLVVAR